MSKIKKISVSEEFVICFNSDSNLGQVFRPTIGGYSPGAQYLPHHLIRNVDLSNNKLSLISPDELRLEPDKKLLFLKFGEVRVCIHTDKIKTMDFKPTK